MSDTFCAMPWSHLHVGVNSQVHLCCISRPIGSMKRNSLEEIWNGEIMKRVRIELLSNKKPKECHACFYREDQLKSTSMRQEMTNEFSQYIDPINDTAPDGSVSDMKLFYVDFRFNNLCNFKCRICSPIYSSSIGSEIIHNTNSKSKSTTIVKNTGPLLYTEIKKQYPHVKKIYFAGGEPVMQKEQFQVLQDLIDSGRASDVSLIYNTNGSKFKNSIGNMFDYWEKFKQVDIIFSIDGYGKPAEYWRSGTNWEEVEANIRIANNHPANINPHIHSVVGWPNIFNWIEFIKYALDTDMVSKLMSSINITVLDNPICYALSVVPKFKKDVIENELTKLKEYVLNHRTFNSSSGTQLVDGIDMLIRSLYAEPRIGNNKLVKEEFRLKNTILDEWRGEDFFITFPEHEDMRPYTT